MKKDLITVLLENFDSFNLKTKQELKEVLKNAEPKWREKEEKVLMRRIDQLLSKLDEV